MITRIQFVLEIELQYNVFSMFGVKVELKIKKKNYFCKST